MLSRIIAIATLVVAGQASLANIIHVPTNYPTLQDAVNAAVDGDTILIADGVYVEDVLIQNKLLVLTSESGDPALCIIEGAAAALQASGAWAHVTLKGVTLSGGNAGQGMIVGSSAIAVVEDCDFVDCFGSSVFVYGELTMTNCVIRDGSAFAAGAGMFVNGGTATLVNCSVLDNELTGANGMGAGIYVAGGTLDLTDCLVTGNTCTGAASHGAGILAVSSLVNMTGGEILNNDLTGGGAGGGFFLDGTVLTIHNASIRQNTAGEGGGINAENLSEVTLVDCLLGGNDTTSGSGGAMRSVNSTFVVNSCTIANNSGAGGASALANAVGSAAYIRNSIVATNTAPDFDGPGTLDITYSCVPSGAAGEGNIAAAPVFVMPLIGNFRLAAGSPGIDAGDTAGYDGHGVDRDGNPRVLNDPAMSDGGISVLGGTIDMGAYEFQPAPACPADATGDGVVDIQDLLLVLGAWGLCN